MQNALANASFTETRKRRWHMEFNQLRYIVEIVEAGSISKASDALFISQPNLSRQISQLEKEIGRQLFQRGNRGVSLTKEGIEVYHYAKQLVSQYEMTREKLLDHISENKIKFATSVCEIIEPAFLQVCKIFNQNNYEFELEYCSIESCIEKLASREVDLAVIPYTSSQYKKLDQLLVNRGLCLQELFTGELKVHVSDQWELSRRPYVRPEDLRGLFHVKKDTLFRGMFSLHYDLKQLGIGHSEKSIVTHQSKTYEDALKTLPSFGITPEWHCSREVNTHLKRLPLYGRHVPVSISMVKRSNEVLRKEVLYFLDELTQYNN